MAGPNDLSGHALLPSGDAKLWIMPAILELFAFPFAWISVQMFHDHELWRAIAGYATTGIVLCVAGVLWAVFRKRIADIWPWRKLRTTKTELVKALADNAELRKELGSDLGRLFSPLQIEAFSIAKELRDFLATLDPFPAQPPHNPGEAIEEYLPRLHSEQIAEKQGKWRARLMHGYANRKFGERVTALMHRLGEQLDYPAYVPTFEETPPMTGDDVRKLAQQMEMMGIWINRKEREEVDLLHPKL
jgi:hypothetical protein